MGTGLQGDKVHLSAIFSQALFPFPLGLLQQYSHYWPLSDSTEFSCANEEQGCQIGQNGTVFTPLEPQCDKLWEAPLWVTVMPFERSTFGIRPSVSSVTHTERKCTSQRRTLQAALGIGFPGKPPAKLTIQASDLPGTSSITVGRKAT